MKQICTELLPFRSHDGWQGLVWRGWEDEFDQVDEWLSSHPGELVVDKPNRTVRRVETPGGQVYVKDIKRLADGRHFWRDILKRIRWYVRPSRAIKVARISAAMLREGVGCPKPLLSVRRRNRWGVPHDVMISEGLPFVSAANCIVAAMNESNLHEVMEAIAAKLAYIHSRGFIHGDGMPSNMLWDGSKLYFIDNDRTRKVGAYGSSNGRMKNLIQFCREIEFIAKDVSVGETFISLYNHACARELAITDKQLRTIQREVRKHLKYTIHKYRQVDWLGQDGTGDNHG